MKHNSIFPITVCFISILVQRQVKLKFLIRQCIRSGRNRFTSCNSSLSKEILIFLIFNNSYILEPLFLFTVLCLEVPHVPTNSQMSIPTNTQSILSPLHAFNVETPIHQDPWLFNKIFLSSSWNSLLNCLNVGVLLTKNSLNCKTI